MRNKVDVRAFAVEQVVKMRCMSDCTIEDVVEQAKLIEGYVVGEAQLSESGDELSEMKKFLQDAMDRLEESRKANPFAAWGIARGVNPQGFECADFLKPNEA